MGFPFQKGLAEEACLQLANQTRTHKAALSCY